jgi:O-antigen ligase
VLTAGAFINAALAGIKTKPVYPGIFLILLCMLFYALPVLYMPYKTAILKGLMKNMEIAFYFLYIVLFFRPASEARAALFFVAAGALIAFAASAYEFYFDRESLDFLIGPAGRLICRIDAGMGLTVFPAYLNIILPASFISMLMSRKNRIVFTLLFIFSALTIASVIALPLSRAGWIVLVIEILFMLFFIGRVPGRKKTGVKTALLCLLSGIIISVLLLYAVHGKYALANVIFRATSSVDENESSYQSAMSRIKYFKIGLKMLRQYPMGIGPGSYKQIVWKYTADKDLDPAYLHHLHNLILQIAVESGVLGLLSMAMLALYLFFACARACAGAKLSFGKLLSLAAGASFLALFLSGLFDMPLVYSRGIFAVFIPALFASHMAFSMKKQD